MATRSSKAPTPSKKPASRARSGRPGDSAAAAPLAAAPWGGRLARLRERLAAAGLDAVIFSLAPNVQYFSGFTSTFAQVVIDAASATLITDGRYRESAEAQLAGWRIECQPPRDPEAWRREFWRARAYRHVGFEGAAPWETVQSWKRAIRPGRLVEAGAIARALRAVKGPEERAALRRSAAAADRVMARILGELRPGLRESEIALFIRRAAEDLGAEGESFPAIVASGPNSSRPHHHPGARRLRAGDFVTLDLGVRLKGYCSDITRTVALGRAAARMREVYDAVLRAQQAALAAIRPGVKTREVDAIARRSLEEAGLGEFFVHGLGHGAGLEIHEAPTLNPRSAEILEEGMAITIEPGVYLPGSFGVRIEDFALVGPRGPELISKTLKEFLVVG